MFHYVCPGGCEGTILPGTCRAIYYTEGMMFDAQCGRQRSPATVDPCVDFNYLQVSCPADNVLGSRPAVLDAGVYPLLQCRVCGLAPLPADGDLRRGYWSGTVSWGPNQFGSSLNEAAVRAYKLYIVDSQYQKIGSAVSTQEVRFWVSLQQSCCNTALYQASLQIELPLNASYFMVVPVTLGGLELNVGPTTTRIKDVGTRAGIASAGHRRERSTWPGALVVAALAALAALPAVDGGP